MTLTVDVNKDEEPDLPDKYTKSQLSEWCNKRNNLEYLLIHIYVIVRTGDFLLKWFLSKFGIEDVSHPTNQIDVLSDPHGLLRASEQHQQGLSLYMKRWRRDFINKPTKPDLRLVPNSKLPPYLQDIERFNPELMNRAKTVEHHTLPTKSVIEDEKRAMEQEGKKLWPDGLVLRKNSTLIDPDWKREQEEMYISEVKRKTKEKTAHVLLGVLQQWCESPEKDHGPEPFPPADSLSSTRVHETNKQVNVSKELDSDRPALETVPEDEEDTDDDRWSTR